MLEALRHPDDEAGLGKLKADVQELCAAFPAPGMPA